MIASSLLRSHARPDGMLARRYTLADLVEAGLPAHELVGVVTPADVVISYDEADAPLMRYLRDGLRASQIGAWADEEKTPGSNRMGPAIAQCSALVTLISASATPGVDDGSLEASKDDVAFAFMSGPPSTRPSCGPVTRRLTHRPPISTGKLIVPVIIGETETISGALPFGMMLMLSQATDPGSWPRLDAALAPNDSIASSELHAAALAKLIAVRPLLCPHRGRPHLTCRGLTADSYVAVPRLTCLPCPASSCWPRPTCRFPPASSYLPRLSPRRPLLICFVLMGSA